MNQSTHEKQHFEKKGLKVDNKKDVERKKLEQRFKGKKKRENFNKLSKDPAFLDYMYELLAMCEYFTPGAGRVNGECYEKKGKLMVANKIADDLTFLSDGGIDEVNKLRRKLHAARVIQLENEGN